MQPFYDYKKFSILYVDDEEKSLKYFQMAFGGTFRILTAKNAEEGFKLFMEHADDIAILMTDQRMPGEKGVQLLEKARQLRPKILRILATAYADFDAAVDAVNSGAIYKYISKPWDVGILDQTLRRGMEFFIVQRERDQLLREKLSVLHNIMITDRVVSLGVLAAGLGHHIRNSLVAIRTFLDLAPEKLREEKVEVEDLRNPNFWRDFYGHVQTQMSRITELLSDLGFAAENAEHRFVDDVSLETVAGATLAKLKSQFDAKNITPRLEVVGTPPPIRADQFKIQRLVELLLIDEALNVPDGGSIQVKIEAATGGVPSVGLVVTDNGPGLAEDSIRAVFDPFFVRYDKPQEFGLNLMACFFIVYHHGGSMEVQSEPGKGTRFQITLPTNPEEHKSSDKDRDFISQVLNNEAMWDRLLSGRF